MALPDGSPQVRQPTDLLLTVGNNGFVKNFCSARGDYLFSFFCWCVSYFDWLRLGWTMRPRFTDSARSLLEICTDRLLKTC